MISLQQRQDHDDIQKQEKIVQKETKTTYLFILFFMFEFNYTDYKLGCDIFQCKNVNTTVMIEKDPVKDQIASREKS